jgi:hypothetical protein
MPKILLGNSGKLKVGASGQLADKDCCCGGACCVRDSGGTLNCYDLASRAECAELTAQAGRDPAGADFRPGKHCNDPDFTCCADTCGIVTMVPISASINASGFSTNCFGGTGSGAFSHTLTPEKIFVTWSPCGSGSFIGAGAYFVDEGEFPGSDGIYSSDCDTHGARDPGVGGVRFAQYAWDFQITDKGIVLSVPDAHGDYFVDNGFVSMGGANFDGTSCAGASADCLEDNPPPDDVCNGCLHGAHGGCFGSTACNFNPSFHLFGIDLIQPRNTLVGPGSVPTWGSWCDVAGTIQTFTLSFSASWSGFGYCFTDDPDAENFGCEGDCCIGLFDGVVPSSLSASIQFTVEFVTE